MLIHTDEDKPDSPPLDVEYRNITSSVINVSWVPPKIPNGVILRYSVYYSNDTESYSQTRFRMFVASLNVFDGLFKTQTK